MAVFNLLKYDVSSGELSDVNHMLYWTSVSSAGLFYLVKIPNFVLVPQNADSIATTFHHQVVTLPCILHTHGVRYLQRTRLG